METFTDRPIVVGLDGSESSAAAAAYAATEAVAREAPLHLLHATGTPAVPVDLYGSMAVELALRDVAEKLLDRMTGSIMAAYPDLAIEPRLVSGPAAAALVTASIGARLLVVGTRGLGGFETLVLGSVAHQVAAHAHCPVVVVRGRITRDGTAPVVAAVDDSAVAEDVLRFAFDAALRHHVPLVVVRAWSPDASVMRPGLAGIAAEQQPREFRRLSEALAGWREEYPDVRVTQRLVRGQAHHVVVSATVGARLAVVGGGEMTRFGVLGRVPVEALHHAGCPVVIVGGGGGADADGHRTADVVGVRGRDTQSR